MRLSAMSSRQHSIVSISHPVHGSIGMCGNVEKEGPYNKFRTIQTDKLTGLIGRFSFAWLPPVCCSFFAGCCMSDPDPSVGIMCQSHGRADIHDVFSISLMESFYFSARFLQAKCSTVAFHNSLSSASLFHMCRTSSREALQCGHKKHVPNQRFKKIKAKYQDWPILGVRFQAAPRSFLQLQRPCY